MRLVRGGEVGEGVRIEGVSGFDGCVGIEEDEDG
jgi:hypothetical protein